MRYEVKDKATLVGGVLAGVVDAAAAWSHDLRAALIGGQFTSKLVKAD